MSMMFLGTALIVKNSKKYIIPRLICGLFGLVISLFLHKSAVLGVSIIVMSLLLSVVETKTYRVIILLIPFIILGMRYLFDNIGFFVSDDEYFDFVADAANRNLTAETSVMGIGSLLQVMLERIPYFLTAICGVSIQRNRYKIPKTISCFANITILLVVISTVLLFWNDYNTRTLSVRLFRFCIIPSTVLLTYCWHNRIIFKLAKTTLWFCLISSSYQLLYAFYVL